MSFNFTSAHALQSSYATPMATPCTIAVWVKDTEFVSDRVPLTVYASGGDNSTELITNSVAGWRTFRTSTPNNSGTERVVDLTQVGWFSLLSTHPVTGRSRIYVAGQEGLDLIAGDDGTLEVTGMDRFRLGSSLTGGSDFVGLLARACAWDKVLDESERNAFASAVCPARIAPANLRKYYEGNEVTVSGAPNRGLDAGALFSFTAPGYSADHPPMDLGTTFSIPGRGMFRS